MLASCSRSLLNDSLGMSILYRVMWPPLLAVDRFMKEDQLPHLLFYGPPGTGKTSTILACARQLYGKKEFDSMVLEVSGGREGGE